MKIIKNKIFVITLLVLIILLQTNVILASNLLENGKYSDTFKEWLALSEEEKEHTIMPFPYEIQFTDTNNNLKNPLYITAMLKSSNSSKFSLKDVISNNVAIKNQYNTESCWTFSAISSLETNLALANLKKGVNTSKIYDFSERHMDYATSKQFANNKENPLGYNRIVGSGGNPAISSSYLTNGSGAIPETEMPFKNNTDLINISEIQNKTVSSQVNDTVLFPDYNKLSDTNKTTVFNQIKQHIQNYGSVSAMVHYGGDCVDYDTGAWFCNTSNLHVVNHAVSIIGWDDKYDKDKFPGSTKPNSNGAWIIRNSWGVKQEQTVSEFKNELFNAQKDKCIEYGWNSAEEIPDYFIKQALEPQGFTVENGLISRKCGDDGIFYISYEDANISNGLFGIAKSTDTVNYDNIYQYDYFFPIVQKELEDSSNFICNIFNKNSSGPEYLNQVSLFTYHTYTCKVYVNPNGTSKSKDDLQLVELKAGDSETFDAGYHSLEFSKPIEIKADSFAVVVEIESPYQGMVLALENKDSNISPLYDYATVETGKCFYATGNDLQKAKWLDLSQDRDAPGDSTLKAFTTTNPSDGTLKSIKITSRTYKVDI